MRMYWQAVHRRTSCPLLTVAEKIGKKSRGPVFVCRSKGKWKRIWWESRHSNQGSNCRKNEKIFSFKNFVDFFKIPLVSSNLWESFFGICRCYFFQGRLCVFPVVMAGWVYRSQFSFMNQTRVQASPILCWQICSPGGCFLSVSWKIFPRPSSSFDRKSSESWYDQGRSAKSAREISFGGIKKVIFVLADHWSRVINNKILDIYPIFSASIRYSSNGEDNFEEVSQKAGILGIKADLRILSNGFLWWRDKGHSGCADLIITRAGANTLSEIAACPSRPLSFHYPAPPTTIKGWTPMILLKMAVVWF